MNNAPPLIHSAAKPATARVALPMQDEDVAGLRRAVVAKLTYAVGKDPNVASDRDWFVATALTVRDRIVDRWMPSTRATYAENRKRVYYLSLEFLIGRLLIDSLSNLDLLEPMRTALAELGVSLDTLREIEPDAALGQWRPRPARRVLHGEHGHAVGRGLRLWHSLRPRPVPAGDQGRLAAGISRRTGCRSAIRGSSSGPRSAT